MRIVILMWPDTFEDWYDPLGIDRASYLDGYDGEWTITATAAMVGAGAEVHVVHGTLRRAETARQEPSGAITHFVPVSPAYRGFRRAVWGHRWWNHTQRLWPAAPIMSTLSPRLLLSVRRLRPDATVIQDYEALRFDVAAPLLRMTGARLVGLDTGGSARPSSSPWKPLALRCAHRLLAAHRAEAERVRRRGHGDVAVWPVPVRTDLFVGGDRREARQRLGLDPDRRIVVSAGRLHAVKGLHDLADACMRLDCDLVLIGAGPEHDALADRRQPRLHLVGRLPASKLNDWYTACDVAALASRQEGQPVAVLEALACGRGVVATAVGGVPDVVEDGVTGWLVPPRDVGSLRDALARALADPADADRRGAIGRDRVVATHASDVVGRELIRLTCDASRPATAQPGRDG